MFARARRRRPPHVCTRPRPTAPHPVTKPRTGGPCTPVVATAFGERTVRRRVCFPELRLPAAASAVGASWQVPALWCVSFRNCPRSCGTPAPIAARPAADVAANGRCGRAHPAAAARPEAHPVSQPPVTARPAPTVVYPRSSSRQRFSSMQRTKKRPAERWSLWRFANYAQIIQRVPSGDDQARRPADGA